MAVKSRKNHYITKEYAKKLLGRLDDYGDQKNDLMGTLNSLGEQGSTKSYSGDIGWQRAQDELAHVNHQIEAINTCLKNAKRLSKPSSYHRVTLGSKVGLISKSKNADYILVDSIEADPMRGKISKDSPIGKAIAGKSLYDIVNVRSGKADKQSHWVISSIK